MSITSHMERHNTKEALKDILRRNDLPDVISDLADAYTELATETGEPDTGQAANDAAFLRRIATLFEP